MTEQEKLRRLERTLDQCGNTHSISDIVDGVRDGRFQWWSNDEGHVVTEIEVFPQLRAARYFLVFGELRACLALQPEIDEWARGHGCSVATAAGRTGWLRAARSSGWRLLAYDYVKQL